MAGGSSDLARARRLAAKLGLDAQIATVFVTLMAMGVDDDWITDLVENAVILLGEGASADQLGSHIFATAIEELDVEYFNLDDDDDILADDLGASPSAAVQVSVPAGGRVSAEDRRLWRDEWLTPRRWQAGEALDYPALLGRHTVTELRRRAAGLGWKPKGLRREDLIANLADHYRDPAMADKALDHLQGTARPLATVIAWLGRPTRAEAALAWQGLAERFGQARLSADLARQAVNLLEANGVVLLDGEWLALPEAFAARLLPSDALSPVPKDLATLKVQPAIDPVQNLARAVALLQEVGPISPLPPQDGGSAGRRGQAVLTPVSQWLPSGPATKDGYRPVPPVTVWIPPRERRRFEAALPDGRPGAPEFYLALYALARPLVAEFLTGRAASDVSFSGLRDICSLGAFTIARLFLAAWIGAPYGIFDELSWAQGSPGRPAFGVHHRDGWGSTVQHFQSDLQVMREQLWMHLVQAFDGALQRADGWVDASELVATIGAARPGLVGPRPESGAMPYLGSPAALWRLADPNGRWLDNTQPADWQTAAARVVEYMLAGPLHWLGLVQLAIGADGRLAACRLTPFGRLAALGQALPARAPTLRWRDAITYSSQPELAAQDAASRLISLSECAAPDGDAFRWQIDRERVIGAYEAGASAADLVGGLEGAGIPLPPATAGQLTTWYEGWGTLALADDLALVEVSSEDLARELLAATALKSRWLVRVSPTSWLVRPAELDALIADFKRAGHRPREQAAEGRAKAGKRREVNARAS